jgi:AcrR family transcriptional regulator
MYLRVKPEFMHHGSVPIERLTPERRRELTRTALIDAASELFAQRGFHATSLEDIAESAGFTRGAIYSNFKNKDELLLAVIERYNELLLHAFGQAFERAEARTHHDRITEAAALWQELLRRDPNLSLLTLELNLHALRNEDFRKRLNELSRKFRKQTTEFVMTEARRSGLELPIAPEDLGDIMWAASEGILILAATDDDPERWDHLIEVFFGLIEEALQSRQTALRSQPS